MYKHFTHYQNCSYNFQQKITQTDKESVITIQVPGLGKEDFKVVFQENYDEDLLIVSRKNSEGEYRTYQTYSIHTSIYDIDKITVVVDKGVLTINLPKHPSKQREYEIN